MRRFNTYTRSVRHELRPADCSSWPVNATGSCSARNPALGNDGLWGKPAEVREFERLRPARAVSSEWVQSSCGIRCVSESPAWRHGRVSSAPAGVVFTEQTAIHRSISVKMWLNPHALLSVLCSRKNINNSSYRRSTYYSSCWTFQWLISNEMYRFVNFSENEMILQE